MAINECSVVIFIDDLYFYLSCIDWLLNLDFCFIKIFCFINFRELLIHILEDQGQYSAKCSTAMFDYE